MQVCPKIYIRRALSEKVTVAPRSHTNRNVFSARLTVQWTSRLGAERTGDCSRSWLHRQRNSHHRMYCWCVEQRTSQYPTKEACVDRSPRWADSCQQGTVAADRAATYGSAAPAWTLRVAGPAANGADEVLALYAHGGRCQWQDALQHSDCPVAVGTGRRSCRRAVSYSSAIGTTQTPAPMSWRRPPTVTWWLAATVSADNSCSDRVRWRGPTDWVGCQ